MLVTALVWSVPAAAQVSVGFSVDNGRLESFHMAVGNYYHVAPREVVVIHDRGIPEEEVPVVFFIAHRTHYSPDAIIQMRLRGESWEDISSRCGLDPDECYGPVVTGPPYGKAWGYYRNHGGGHPRHVYSDDEIVTYVNRPFKSYARGYDHGGGKPGRGNMHGHGRHGDRDGD